MHAERFVVDRSSHVQAGEETEVAKQPIETTLGASFEEFRSLAETTKKTLVTLAKEHRALCSDIDVVVKDLQAGKGGPEGSLSEQKLHKEVHQMVEDVEKQAVQSMSSEEKIIKAKERKAKQKMIMSLSMFVEDE